MSEGNTLGLRGEYITLAQAIKVVGLAGTGGQAKLLIREGGFQVNGAAEVQPGRKLRAGDRFAAPASLLARADGARETIRCRLERPRELGLANGRSTRDHRCSRDRRGSCFVTVATGGK